MRDADDIEDEDEDADAGKEVKMTLKIWDSDVVTLVVVVGIAHVKFIR